MAPLLPKLRGHFAEFLNNASPVGLRILSSSTCVGLRYGHLSRNSSFSRQCGFRNFSTSISIRITLHPRLADLPTRCDFVLARSFPFCAFPILLRPCSSDNRWYWNFNQLSIDYDFRPRLRSRLTQGRSALPWKPWIFGPEDSHFSLATHSGILSSYPSTAPFGTASSVLRMLLYHSHCESTASVSCFSPGHFRRRNSRLVSCYALFECMAASEPTS